jgi:hypothetical protein
MRSTKTFFLGAAVLCATMCGGCAVPRYDVPYDIGGQPTVKSIVDRVQCEIRDMVRNDRPDDPTTYNRLFLLNGDYDVEISLSLEVNDTGGLSPSLTYMTPLSAATSFMFNANGTFSESRDHNFTENVQLSVRSIFLDWRDNVYPHDCPAFDTNLSGTLGLRDIVAMAASSEQLDTSKGLDKGGVFGGSVQFLVTKNIAGAGPTWTLVNFKGPGPLGTFSEVHTDKITLAFAWGPNVGKPMPPPGKRVVAEKRQVNANAYLLLQQLLASSINSQLTALQAQNMRVLQRGF